MLKTDYTDSGIICQKMKVTQTNPRKMRMKT